MCIFVGLCSPRFHLAWRKRTFGLCSLPDFFVCSFNSIVKCMYMLQPMRFYSTKLLNLKPLRTSNNLRPSAAWPMPRHSANLLILSWFA